MCGIVETDFCSHVPTKEKQVDSQQLSISMDEVKARLASLRDHLPSYSDELIYEFSAFISERLEGKKSLTPLSFNSACVIALYDLEKGVDGFTGQAIQNPLARLQKFTYLRLALEIPDIARAVFPREFAAAVNEQISKLRSQIYGQE
jgi:hypothetical protein